MGSDPTYVLDANVFIEAARRYYAFDLAPSFWASVAHYASLGRVQSIDRVKGELERGKDALARWVSDGSFDGFASTNEEKVIESYGEIMIWVQAQRQFLDGAKADFAKGADGWLISYARVKGCILVTH